MVQLRRLVKSKDNTPEKIIDGTNRIIDALLGNTGGRIHLIDDDGVLRETRGGAVLGTNEPSLKVRSAIGEHVLIQHSDGVTTILEAQDSGVTINGLDLTGNLDVAGDLTVEGNTNLGNAITDTTLIAGPLTANATINVKGNSTFGDANTDTALFSGPVTMNETLNVKANVTLGDTAGDTVHIVGLLNVDVDATISGELEVQGNVQLGNGTGDTVNTAGPLTVGDNLTVDEDADIAGSLEVGSGIHVTAGSSLFDDAVTISSGGLSITTGGLQIGTPPNYTVSNPSTSRSLDVAAATLPQLRAVVGTIIEDIQTFLMFS